MGPAGLRIGRGSASDDADPSDVRLADPLLSRNHLGIVRKPGGCEIVDPGSLNGTFVDGVRLNGPARLSEGAVVSFGRQTAVFKMVPREALAAIDEEARSPLGPVPTMSPALALELSVLRRLASSEAHVLLLGETGVGKEVYARSIHEASGRRGRFVAVNCAAIPMELAESELFGYARGAHSTATDAKQGLIESARGGTLFLDEIGEANPGLQAKLLRFLQDKQVRAVGATEVRQVDVKVIAATQNVLDGDGREVLREDIVGRFGAEPVTIPPLRQRIEDVAALVAHFLGQPAVSLAPEAIRALHTYSWPRNVRELEQTLKRAVLLARDDGGEIALRHLPAALREAALNGRPIEVSDRRRRPPPTPAELKDLLVEHDGNVAAVARALDRQWNVVWRWVTKHQLVPERRRDASES
jgi:transcriptional regulator with PAS, ATPase and Fis domain